MKHPKSFYRSLSHAGYSWGGFWDGHHVFVKPANSQGGVFEMRVLESDIEDGSWKFMAEHGLTRI
jgi:hypothetical protein